MVSGNAAVFLERIERIERNDLATAKIVSTALGARLGLMVTLNENSGVFRVLGASGMPEEVPTLSGFLMLLYMAIDGELAGG